MSPSAERLLRPVLAFLTLCLAAFLLSPTVASVHQMVDDLDIQRELPFHLWKWYDEPRPPSWPDCGGAPRRLYSEITQWPDKIEKDQKFTLRGVVQDDTQGRIGVADIDVDVFLNASKSEPGIALGSATSGPGGYFDLPTASVPFDLQAAHYHIVAHAKFKRLGCTTYLEHWSDPEMDVVSKTSIVWDPVDVLVAGRDTTFGGQLVDSVGGPVKNATVNVTVGGETFSVVTDETGRFGVEHRPTTTGEIAMSAEYEGSAFYSGSKNATKQAVAKELLEFAPGPFVVARGEPATLGGEVYVADDAREETITIDLDGLNATACEGCPANDTFVVPVGPDGAFTLTFTVPSSESPGVYALDVSGGGLAQGYNSTLTVEVVTTITLEARGTELFARDYEGRATLVDEAGRPLAGSEIALFTPEGWTSNVTGADGAIAFRGEGAACGPTTTEARFNGSKHLRGSSATEEIGVCGYLAFLPPWLVAVPWWVWPLALVALFASWRALRAWRERFASTIMGGPPLTLTFTEPADDAAGYAAIGETVVATAFLEEPLPDGHALRMGTYRESHEVPLDAELRAHLRIVPEKLGGMGVRAEVVDAKGRVVSRRTLALKVVRYAEEIERRYLERRAQSGLSEAVTPREFERWLHKRAPALDAALVRRLVHVFEEADYSPRVAGRAELAAYLAAERGMEVTADAPLP